MLEDAVLILIYTLPLHPCTPSHLHPRHPPLPSSLPSFSPPIHATPILTFPIHAPSPVTFLLPVDSLITQPHPFQHQISPLSIFVTSMPHFILLHHLRPHHPYPLHPCTHSPVTLTQVARCSSIITVPASSVAASLRRKLAMISARDLRLSEVKGYGSHTPGDEAASYAIHYAAGKLRTRTSLLSVLFVFFLTSFSFFAEEM